jgi:transcriptional regulator with XRE-family HTH domain
MQTKPTTIKEIAQILGISVSTVSRALHDHPSIGITTRAKVKKLAGELNYEPNQTAIFLQKGKTHTIGVILPELSEAFFSSAISAIEDTAYKKNYTVLLAQSHDDEQKNNDENDGAKLVFLGSGTLRNGSSGALVVTASCLDERVDSGGHARIVVAVLKIGFDPIFRDVFRGDIGNRAFQPVANLEEHFPVVDKDKENRSVAFALLADFPVLSDAQSVIVNRRLRLHVFVDRDNDLG